MIRSRGRSYQELSAGVYRLWLDSVTTVKRQLESIEVLIATANRDRIKDQAKPLADAWAAVASARRELLRAPKPPGVDGGGE